MHVKLLLRFAAGFYQPNMGTSFLHGSRMGADTRQPTTSETTWSVDGASDHRNAIVAKADGKDPVRLSSAPRQPSVHAILNATRAEFKPPLRL